MLRILIVATLLMLVTATSVQAGSAEMRDGGVIIQLQIAGAGVGARTILQPAVRAGMSGIAMYRTINGVAQVQPAADNSAGMLAPFGLDDRSGLALPVSDSVSLGLRYQYLRREDMRLDVAETASLDDGYTSHNVLLHARWRF